MSATLRQYSPDELRSAEEAALTGPTTLQFPTTRLTNHLGVDLKAPTAAQNRDVSLIGRVEEALRRMGIKVGGRSV